jgi:hypothetical protein
MQLCLSPAGTRPAGVDGVVGRASSATEGVDLSKAPLLEILKHAIVFALPLLAADALFILAHVVEAFMGAPGVIHPTQRWTSLHDARSIASHYAFAKMFLLAALVLLAGLRSRNRAVIAAGVFMTILAVDDMLELHEAMGGLINAHALSRVLSDRFVALGSHIGELLVALVYAGAFALILLAMQRSPERVVRRFGLALVGYLALLGLCGVGFDFAHVVADLVLDRAVFMEKLASSLIALAEDGGELIAVSFGVGLAAVFLRRAPWGTAAPAMPAPQPWA